MEQCPWVVDEAGSCSVLLCLDMSWDSFVEHNEREQLFRLYSTLYALTLLMSIMFVYVVWILLSQQS